MENENTTEETTAPAAAELKLKLVASGRDPRTQERRRVTQPRRRTFWIGEMYISGNISYDVTLEWCKKNFTALVEKISEGTVILQHSYDNFVDPRELHTLCFGTGDEQAELIESNIEETEQRSADAIAETEAALAFALAQEPVDPTADTEAPAPAAEEAPQEVVAEELPPEATSEPVTAEEEPTEEVIDFEAMAAAAAATEAAHVELREESSEEPVMDQAEAEPAQDEEPAPEPEEAELEEPAGEEVVEAPVATETKAAKKNKKKGR